MLNSNLVKEIIADFHERHIPEYIPRQINLACPENKIRTIIGARRVGKTFAFYQLIHDLIQSGTSKDSILSINFEDERLWPATAADISQVLDIFYELYPNNKDKKIHIFFDEIQNVDNWERFIRRVFDQGNISINLTGSSSKLLSRELSTALRGRTLDFEISPFNFHEYVLGKGIAYNSHTSKTRSFLVNAFENYLRSSGFPETINYDDATRMQVLQNYFNLTIFKDLVERYEIRNYAFIKYLLKTLLMQSGKSFSVNKFFNDLKSQGMQISKNTLHNYIAMIEDVFIIALVPLYTESLRKQQSNYRKLYALDHGFIRSLSPFRSLNSGHILETIAYNELRRSYAKSQIYYYLTHTGNEIDFVATAPGKEPILFQVCETLADPATKEREVNSLVIAMGELELQSSTIITRNEEEMIKIDGRTIEITPFWRWALPGWGNGTLNLAK